MHVKYVQQDCTLGQAFTVRLYLSTCLCFWS